MLFFEIFLLEEVYMFDSTTLLNQNEEKTKKNDTHTQVRVVCTKVYYLKMRSIGLERIQMRGKDTKMCAEFSRTLEKILLFSLYTVYRCARSLAENSATSGKKMFARTFVLFKMIRM